MSGLCAVVSVAASGSPSAAMEFSLLPSETAGKIVIATGEIRPGDERLHQFVTRLSSNDEIIGIVLSSPGGNYVEGVRLATSVRNSHIKSGVVPGSICASACFLIFAAGMEKFMFEGARLAVHSASSMSGAETTASQALTTLMARKASELGVPPAVIGTMVTTLASEIAWLDDGDLQATRVDSPASAYEPGSALKPGSGKAQPGAAAAQAPPAAAVRPVTNVPAPDSPAATVTPSLTFQQGNLDRTAYETWFNALDDEMKLGAAWWAGNRSQAARHHMACARPGSS